MTTDVLCKLAAALRIWLAEQVYQQQTATRIETLALAGLTFEGNELEVTKG